MIMKSHDEVTILLVDDDEGHAELVRMNLERSGISNEIRHFADGQYFMDYLYGGEYTPLDRFLVILDLNMPRMDGHQVLRFIKSDQHFRHLPVIVLTTALNEAEIARCYQEGCNLYIAKPMDYEDFSNAVNELGLFLQTASLPGIQTLVSQAESR